MNNEFEKLSNIFKHKQTKKPPAYQWQELALRIIKELRIPNFKKSSVFKICKEKPKQYIEQALADTKELCTNGEKWKYFFKIIANREENKIEKGN